MDQLMLDLGPDSGVRVGDEVVLIGSEGEKTISAWDVALKLGTIPYEIFTGITIVCREFISGGKQAHAKRVWSHYGRGRRHAILAPQQGKNAETAPRNRRQGDDDSEYRKENQRPYRTFENSRRHQ